MTLEAKTSQPVATAEIRLLPAGFITFREGVPKRIMAVDPGMQHLAVAILEGEKLIGYAVKTFTGRKSLPYMRPQVQQYLTGFLQKYAPQILVVEEPFYAQSMLNKNLKTLTEDIKTWGRWNRLRVYSYLPISVKAFFCRDRKNKESLAEAMVERFPFLKRYLTILPWKRRYWFHVFDAVGLALMHQRKINRAK